MRSPITVPGPTRVSCAFSLAVSIAAPPSVVPPIVLRGAPKPSVASTLLPLGDMKSRLVVPVAALIIGAGAGVMPSGAAERGADVARAQEALKQQGHDPGPIDGVYGPRTAAALKAYQQSQQLEATGQLDDATLARLGERAS